MPRKYRKSVSPPRPLLPDQDAYCERDTQDPPPRFHYVPPVNSLDLGQAPSAREVEFMNSEDEDELLSSTADIAVNPGTSRDGLPQNVSGNLRDSRISCSISRRLRCKVDRVSWGGKSGRKGPLKPIKMLNTNSRKPSDRHPSVVLKEGQMYHVRVGDIGNLSDFFLEFILAPPRNECGYNCKTWDDCLQHYYNLEKTQLQYKMRTIRPINGQLYVICDPETKLWERILVKDIQHATETVVAVYMDRLWTSDEIPINYLYELHPRYGYWPRYPLRGMLTGIAPLHGQAEWPEETVDYFTNLVKDKMLLATFTTIAVDTLPVWGEYGINLVGEEQYTWVEAILFEETENGPQVPINALMVEQRHAKYSDGDLDGNREDWVAMTKIFRAIED